MVMASRRERKKRIKEQRERQILDAALLVFSHKGFDKATVPDIACQAGIAVGTIYNYYPSKHEVFVAVIRNSIITPALLELIDNLPKGDITVTFKHILQNRFELLESGLLPHIPTLMAETQRDPELKALWTRQFLQPFLARMEDVYRKLTESGRYRRLEPSVAVRSIGGMLLGFLMLRMMEGETSPLKNMSKDEITREMMELLFHGVLEESAGENDQQESKP
jgi:AcrR family transcriptional regulator